MGHAIWEAIRNAAYGCLVQQRHGGRPGRDLGEDPRYTRSQSESFTGRFGHVVKATFLTRNRRVQLMPAYARYISISGSNFISNAWRPDSQATVGNAVFRT